MTFDGDCYYIVGRMGDVIIGENGENINPDTIEQRFNLPEAINFSVLGLKDGEKEKVCMVVQIGDFMSDAKRNALTEKMYAQNDMLPITSRVQKFYYTQDAIAPPNAVKVGRKYLLRGVENGDISLCPAETFQKSETVSEYSENLLKTVTEIVAKHLNVAAEEINIHAHLMLDMGATSMQYFSILAELGEKFSLKTEESEALRYTVHEMCQYIERRL
ncbi:MAG: non-ribosomal peptide synthetase, partial [Clostridia bacterium]|nr:non-ribosomal peptide synthetase [Clostridia bacterium]